MKSEFFKWKVVFSLVFLLTATFPGFAQSVKRSASTIFYPETSFRKALRRVEKKDVRAHMEFLASDALQGRGSGTQFELIAGKYLAAQMQQFGIEPAGTKTASGKKSYIQNVKINRNTFAQPPEMRFSNSNAGTGEGVTFVHGKEMVIFRINSANVKGKLQKITFGEKINKGAVVLVKPKDGTGEMPRSALGTLMDSGAAAVLIEETTQLRRFWNGLARRPVSFTAFEGSNGNFRTALIIVSKDAMQTLEKTSEGIEIKIGGNLGKPETRQTWNAVGMIPGRDARRSKEVILLSAHMDHVGVRPNAPGEDKIFNGADDDASGCVAVIELARILASGKRPKRTVYFAFFGSEEAGGLGSRYFVNNLPFAKENFVANLQFEMIGRPDPAVGKDELWLTGFDRSNLGAELARRGAKLVNDPHPEQNFFRRSDNYALARQGIIAHTVSSFGLHKDYHQPSDEIETIDFDYMTQAINSMIKPVRWLANSKFRPTWYEGKKP